MIAGKLRTALFKAFITGKAPLQAFNRAWSKTSVGVARKSTLYITEEVKNALLIYVPSKEPDVIDIRLDEIRTRLHGKRTCDVMCHQCRGSDDT